MDSRPPKFQLSRGQLAWALARGEEPSDLLLAQLRYLRQLGIPFADGERGAGRGHRIIYDFHDLMETGIAYEALKYRVQPRYLRPLVEDRKRYHELYDLAFSELLPAAWNAKWIRSKENMLSIISPEYYVRVHDRFDTEPGTFSITGWDEDEPQLDVPFGTPVELLPGEPPKIVIPVKHLMLELVTWAREAPATRPGPKV